MKYLSKSFSTPANSRAYVENWERTFGEKQDEPHPSWPTEHESDCPAVSGGDCRCPMGNL